jgi:hypothetical protein
MIGAWEDAVTAQECLTRLRRRWYVLILVALCTLGALWAVYYRTITYQGCDSLYLAATRMKRGVNTYAYISPSIAMTTGMVAQTMMSQEMQEKLESHGATEGYEVSETNTGDVEFPNYTQPTLEVCSSSSDPLAVLRTTALVTEEFRIVLYRMQVAEHVPSKSLIGTVVLTRTYPTAITGRPSQAYLGVVLVGMVSGVAIALWIDPPLKRRQERRLGAVARTEPLVPRPRST